MKLGKYDYVNSDINKFPYEETDTGEIEIINFGKSISSEDAIKELDKKGYRPATATELLLLGAQHPDLQRKDPIVALGTMQPVDDRRVAYLDGYSTDRFLLVSWFVLDWFEHYVFAAVRKYGSSDARTLGAVELESLEARISELEEFKKKIEKIIKL